MEQCLYSVCAAIRDLSAEIIVVDNHSTDESLPYLVPKFPAVNFITNGTNSGFGKACNRGLAAATGDYILFLNPDTLIAEDSLEKSIHFFTLHPDCGAVGVKMIDGSGRFLKESKRAFPSPLTSLFKLAGLAYLFPHSKIFSRYHLGHLDKEQTHEVDVLAGAFLMTTAEVLQGVGSFDEAFFMYGEDVDLSYRIQAAGYKNYYYPGTTIIHFKGESTRRGSLNYVRMFYQAMSIFVQKHYGGTRAGIFHFSIQAAIRLRAFVAIMAKTVKWVGVPVIDAVIILLSFYGAKEVWTTFVRTDIVYPDKLLLVAFPAFTAVYLVAAYYAGLYNRYYKTKNLWHSTFVATIALLTLYALLPEHYRFSRGIVVLGAFIALVAIALLRRALLRTGLLLRPPNASSKPHILIAANGKEFSDAKKFLTKKGAGDPVIGRVGINGSSENVISHIDTVGTTVKALDAKELIFCAHTLSYKSIISLTEKNSNAGLKFRYHACNSGSMVGSDASTESGEAISTEAVFNLSAAANRRLKRLLDVVTALLFILSYPFLFFRVQHAACFFMNCLAVLTGNKTWVGYLQYEPSLPALRKSVLAANGPKAASAALSDHNRHLLDYWYARNYEPAGDVKTIFACYKFLGSE